jgi:hypothetical protein
MCGQTTIGCGDMPGELPEPEYPVNSEPIALQPEGTLIASAVVTKVGMIEYLLPGQDGSGGPRRVMVADFYGNELASGEAGHVTIVFEMPEVKDWLLRVLTMITKIGWWSP